MAHYLDRPCPKCGGYFGVVMLGPELLVTTLATADALAKLLIEKGLSTQAEFMAKISEERAVYQRMLNPTVQ